MLCKKREEGWESHIVEGSELSIVASDNNIIDISHTACEVVSRVGSLARMANHLQTIMQ